MNIVFLDGHTLNPGDISWQAFEVLGHFTVYDRTRRSDILPRAAEADILIVNKTPLEAAHFEALPQLKLVCVAATGYDVVDVEAARRHHIPVCNAAGYGSRAVAQMVTALLLEVTNRVGHYAQANREGFWSRSDDFCYWNFPLTELVDKRMAIVGFGHIGQCVADIMRSLGLRLYAVSGKPQEALPPDVKKITLETAFSDCDIVSLNCPLTPANAGFVNRTLLEKARRGLILINTARGKLIDEHDVAEALRDGRLGAYCCDVLSSEPPAPDNPILSAPNAYVTPHIAWATAEARQRIIRIIVDNIKAYLAGRPINVVNGVGGTGE